LLIAGISFLFAAPSPELPGQEIDETQFILQKSQIQVNQQNTKTVSTNTPSPPNHTGWLAPSFSEQLSADPILIPMNMGAVFIPSMTESRLEPPVLIFRENQFYLSGTTGARLLLEPGAYDLVIGSGERAQRAKISVIIREGHTTLVNPTWSGLTIETLNSDGEYVEEEYEIYTLHSLQYRGKGYGVKEERLNSLKTWFLPPGLYRISKAGTDPSSYDNYITVQLLESQLTSLELVYSPSEPFDLIAGGYKGLRTHSLSSGNWRYGLRLGGTLYYNDKTQNGINIKSALNMQVDIHALAHYRHSVYLGTTDLRIRNSLDRSKGKFNPGQDEAQLRSTWVRQWTPWLGPYIRGKAKTHFFPKSQEIQSGYIVSSRPQGGIDTLETLNAGSLKINPVFFPIELGEGSGVSIIWSSQDVLDISFQAGAAARQVFVKNQLVNVPNKPDLWKRGQGEYSYGLESNATLRLRLGKGLTLDLLADAYLEDVRIKNYRIEDLSGELRYSLTRYLEISYQVDLEDNWKEFDIQNPNRFIINQGVFMRMSLKW